MSRSKNKPKQRNRSGRPFPGQVKDGEEIDIKKLLDDMKPVIKEAIEKNIPRVFNKENMKFFCGEARYAYDIDSANKSIAIPLWEILDRGGKMWRPALLLFIAEAMGGDLDDVLDLTAVCEVVHNGTLIVDDIEDNSLQRRNKPCLHKMYGTDVAVNCGNMMYFLPIALFKSKSFLDDKVMIRMYELYIEELIKLHFGQGFDIWWHNGNKNPSIEEYLQMCAYKTGTLARLSAKLSALVSGCSEDMANAVGVFAESIGVAFQIQDDILNLVGEGLAATKGQVGEDIQEGKRTLMVIHCFETAPKEKTDRLREIFGMKEKSIAVVTEAISIMEQNGSIEYAKKRGKEIVKKAWVDVKDKLPNNVAKKKTESFCRFSCRERHIVTVKKMKF